MATWLVSSTPCTYMKWTVLTLLCNTFPVFSPSSEHIPWRFTNILSITLPTPHFICHPVLLQFSPLPPLPHTIGLHISLSPHSLPLSGSDPSLHLPLYTGSRDFHHCNFHLCFLYGREWAQEEIPQDHKGHTESKGEGHSDGRFNETRGKIYEFMCLNHPSLCLKSR